MNREAQRRSYDSFAIEVEAARKRTDDAARIARGLVPEPDRADSKPDMSRTAYVLGMIGIALLLMAVLLVNSWYQASLVQYPPDRPLIQQEKDQCDEAARKGWPQSPYCKYR